MVLESPRHDFGKVVQGEWLTHVYVVRNAGGQPLEIQSVLPSCGCTLAELAEKHILPGLSTRIDVKIDTRGQRGQEHQSITVSSNDPEAGSAILEFTADVEPPLRN